MSSCSKKKKKTEEKEASEVGGEDEMNVRGSK